MEWYEAFEFVKPHVVQIFTPRGRGTGFFISASARSDLIAVATAAHVVLESEMWEEPIRFFHPHSNTWRLLRARDRMIRRDPALDTAAIVFYREGFPLPSLPLASVPEGNCLKVANEVGWVGFPAVSSMDLCFFSGKISAWKDNEGSYLVDGVAINGVSGGPAFSLPKPDEVWLIGVMSAYIPNMTTGVALPGLSVIHDVKQFHQLAKEFKSVDEARSQQKPDAAPPAAEQPPPHYPTLPLPAHPGYPSYFSPYR